MAGLPRVSLKEKLQSGDDGGQYGRPVFPESWRLVQASSRQPESTSKPIPQMAFKPAKGYVGPRYGS